MNCDSRAPWWRAVVAGCVLVAAAALYSGAVDARSGDLIWEGNDQSVVLSSQDDDNAPPNEHPVTLSPQDIERMLSGLRFTYPDQEADASPAAVFNREQVGILGDALAAGLSRATPSQDVTFSVIGAHRLAPGAFARRNRLTAGRAFFQDGKLNIIFGEIQSPYRKKNIYGRLEEDFYPRQFGSRTTPEAQESVLVAGAGASLRAEPNGKRDDWIEIDPAIDASVAEASSRLPSSETVRPAAKPPDERHRQTSPATSVPQPKDSPERAESRPEEKPDLDQRLETLKRLRDKDLISEDVYREKVDEVLDDL